MDESGAEPYYRLKFSVSNCALVHFVIGVVYRQTHSRIGTAHAGGIVVMNRQGPRGRCRCRLPGPDGDECRGLRHRR